MKTLLWACLLLVLDDITTIHAQEACSPEGAVRLQGLPIVAAGRVEFCRGGVWGTVCDESIVLTPWSEKNGQVVCRALGYSGALNPILQDRLPLEARAPPGTPVHIRGVFCLGHEDSLGDCFLTGNSGTCTHDQDVAITCRSVGGETGEDGDVRLVGDERNGYGAVQLRDFRSGFIGICPDDGTFGDSEASIVCQQLGYESGTTTELSDNFGGFFSNLKAEGFDCDSEATFISRLNVDCSYTITTQCSTTTLVGVACEMSLLPEGSIRLFGGSTRGEGRVEILFNGRWGRICSTLWDNTDGEVACGELGLRTDSVSTSIIDSFPGEDNNIQPIWLSEVDCSSSSPESLSECFHLEPTGFADCYNVFNTFAVLDCGESESTSGLSSGAITGVVFAVIFIAFFVVPFGWAYGKEYWDNRERYALYRCLVWPFRQCNRCLDNCSCPPWDSRPTRRRTSVHIATPAATTVTMTERPRRPSTPSSESEPEIEREEQEQPELIKAPPPSYRAASNFPAADPTDLPPPYPGPPSAPAAYPPPTGGAAYPPPTGGAAYPPPTGGAAYPPPGGDLAYPPATGPGAGLQGYPPPTLDLAYPPATASAPAPYPVEPPQQQPAPVDPILAEELLHAPGSIPGELPYPPDNQQSS